MGYDVDGHDNASSEAGIYARYLEALRHLLEGDEDRPFEEVKRLGAEAAAAQLPPDLFPQVHSAALQQLRPDASRGRGSGDRLLAIALLAYAKASHAAAVPAKTVMARIPSERHDLRAPLNSIIGFSTVLLEEWAGPLNEEQKENVRIILNSGRRLLAVVDEVMGGSVTEREGEAS